VHWQPECWKRRYGKPDFASDIFSFGMMLWEILARVHIYTAFPGVADIPKPDGTTNVELVAARIANGQRPSAPPEGCPVLLFKVMQACWVRKMSARPTAPWLLDAMKALRASAGALDGPEPEPEPEPADASPSYDDWLRSLDMQEKKDELAEWDVTAYLDAQELEQFDAHVRTELPRGFPSTPGAKHLKPLKRLKKPEPLTTAFLSEFSGTSIAFAVGLAKVVRATNTPQCSVVAAIARITRHTGTQGKRGPDEGGGEEGGGGNRARKT
jgi:hypothetical protein